MFRNSEYCERDFRTWSGRLMALVAVTVVVFQLSSELHAGYREMVRKALPATVHIEAKVKTIKVQNAVPGLPPHADQLFKNTTNTEELLLSSGTLVSADGLIVTIVEIPDSAEFSVTLADGRQMPAKLMVDDQRTRLKLLKIDASDLPHLAACEQPLQVGDDVAWTFCLDAKGRGAGHAMVVATGRDVAGFGYDLIQLDARVAQLSAGGPVLDESGKLAGIVAVNQSSGGQTVSFAIPVRAVQQLLEFRRENEPAVIRRGVMGIALTQGAGGKSELIADPTSESPAFAAGIKKGDVILEIDGVKVSTIEDVLHRGSLRRAGDVVKVKIRRDDAEKTFDISLAPAPATARNTPRELANEMNDYHKRIEAVRRSREEIAAKIHEDATRSAQSNTKPVLPQVRRGESLYIVDAEGKLQTIPFPTDEKTGEAFRRYLHDYYDALGKQVQQSPVVTDRKPVQSPSVPSVQVQRSDVEKKLEEIGRDVATLRQQMEKLTEELKQLQEQLTESRNAEPKKE